jgi:hypothetical protein
VTNLFENTKLINFVIRTDKDIFLFLFKHTHTDICIENNTFSRYMIYSLISINFDTNSFLFFIMKFVTAMARKYGVLSSLRQKHITDC